MTTLNDSWNRNWKTVLIWVSAYLSFIAFVIVGGYFFTKSEDKEAKAAAKNAFVVTLLFTAANAAVAAFGYIIGCFDASDAFEAYTVKSVFNAIIGIGEIATYATATIMALLKKDEVVITANIAEVNANTNSDNIQ